jgi:hypothetical protein
VVSPRVAGELAKALKHARLAHSNAGYLTAPMQQITKGKRK